MKTKKFIVYLGYSAFPNGFAEVQKMILISKSLLLAGDHVAVICRNGTHNQEKQPELKDQGVYENIEYFYASGSPFRNENFFCRRYFEIKGKINEVLLLIKLKKKNKLDYAILSTRSFYSILVYRILSKIFRFKTILNYVEYYSALKKNRFQISRRLNDRLFDKYAPSLSDAVFPISEFLITHIKKVSPGKKYFLFIIDSFELLNNSTSFFLYLVINGNENDIAAIKKYVRNCAQKDRIKLFSRLTEKELYTYYKNATALLIPLRPTLQDIARFPHKTGEYLASGNPVISTNYGEIKYYFSDKKNMLIADRYDTTLFAEKMQFVIDNPEDVKNIGLKGKDMASMFSITGFGPGL